MSSSPGASWKERHEVTPEQLLQQQVDDLRRLLTLREDLFRATDDENTRLAAQLCETQAELQSLGARHRHLEAQHAAGQHEAAALSRQLQAATQERANAERYAARMQMHLADMQHRVAEAAHVSQASPASASGKQQQGFKIGLGSRVAGLSLDGGADSSLGMPRSSSSMRFDSERIEEALARSCSAAAGDAQAQPQQQSEEKGEAEEGVELEEEKPQQQRQVQECKPPMLDSPEELQRRLHEARGQRHADAVEQEGWANDRQPRSMAAPAKNGLLAGLRRWQVQQHSPQ